MKIWLTKISSIPVTITRYIHDELFSFTIDFPPNFYEKQLYHFDSLLAMPQCNTKLFLSRKLAGSWLPQETTVEAVMQMNFNHVFRATEYFTNGQKIATLIQTDQGFEIGFHDDMIIFDDYCSPAPTFAQFSISNLKTETFKVYERAITEIGRYLSKIEVIKIPMNFGTVDGFLEIRPIHPLGFIFKIGDKEIYMDLSKLQLMDRITQEIVEWAKPNTLKCCFNCKNFEFTGMSHDMSGGAAGHCKYIKDMTTDNQTKQSITHIWNLCEVFEKRNADQ